MTERKCLSTGTFLSVAGWIRGRRGRRREGRLALLGELGRGWKEGGIPLIRAKGSHPKMEEGGILRREREQKQTK